MARSHACRCCLVTGRGGTCRCGGAGARLLFSGGWRCRFRSRLAPLCSARPGAMSPAVVAKEGGRQRRPGSHHHCLDVRSEVPPALALCGDGLAGGEAEALLPPEPGTPTARGPRGYRAELGSVLLLLALYVLQGIPLGLAGSVPLILQSKNASYTEQAFFSFVFWPFSLKLLWAPLVDAVYLPRFGRRKSWLVPTQYVLGLFMIYLSTQVDLLLGDGQGRGPDVVALTVTFFLFEFLAATQDIAVDGWALTMLSRENVGYASTCNSVGQTAGYFLGNVLFLALESASFCNKYLRFQPQPRGIVTLSDFLFFWGAVFLITTTLVALFKKENKELTPTKEETKGISDTYKLLFSIIKMPAVLTFCLLILTAKVGFSAADAVTGLKLVEEGVPKEHLALLAVPMVPLQIILPLIISKYTAGPQPLNTFYKAMPFRLLLGLGFAFLVWWTPKVRHEGGFPIYYYAVVLLSYALHQISLYSMYVAIMAFNAKVSDPLIGGTYMTLLNTVSNLGGNWPSTVALWLVDPLTVKECIGAQEQACGNALEAELCTKAGGSCVTTLDGYYVESVVCVILGFGWWFLLGPKFKKLQDEGQSSWKCKRTN
ncbi:acetyl-coenzyme A transporter 1 [Numida meleagris]|uniref:acetyl-coenzyme A transporter 1 n=1 Tax=Numida meleagris TaxID=8996 RepID=UPI000B3DF75F|nr:acetyl-coenzyme A transporter 1 [Numida meleagris]